MGTVCHHHNSTNRIKALIYLLLFFAFMLLLLGVLLSLLVVCRGLSGLAVVRSCARQPRGSGRIAAVRGQGWTDQLD